MSGWTEKDIRDLTGLRAVVTGANAGLGFRTALELYRAGAEVVLAVRNTAKGADAAARIRLAAREGTGSLRVSELDLSDLAGVAAFADRELPLGPVDLLVANAGIMMVPRLQQTADGFESQMGTNHLGHYALIGRMLPALSPTARVVSLSSMAHRGAGPLDRGLGLVGKYTPMSRYAQSKLATAMFAVEFDRRLRAAGSTVLSVAAHPGWCATDLFNRTYDDAPSRWVTLSRQASALLGSPVEHGVRPQLRAAVGEDVSGGDYLGPRFMIRGAPVKVSFAGPVFDRADGSWLWEESAELTGVTFDL
ncbi:SDR family NAD(P)-dependent oxidoreductase [Nakamurella silvestris]|nr:SDR family NAD(P)-dependent oxidoreductase [Nakamurella silvestris]